MLPFSRLKSDRHLTIFGEWCGSNIQKGLAISEIERKVLAVFAPVAWKIVSATQKDCQKCNLKYKVYRVRYANLRAIYLFDAKTIRTSL